MLQNNAEKLIDPDLRRKYDLDLVTSGNNVYEVKRKTETIKHKDGTTETKTRIVEKKLMARVYALSTFYTDKGSIFDKDLSCKKVHLHCFKEFLRVCKVFLPFDGLTKPSKLHFIIGCIF